MVCQPTALGPHSYPDWFTPKYLNLVRLPEQVPFGGFEAAGAVEVFVGVPVEGVDIPQFELCGAGVEVEVGVLEF